MLGQRNRRRKRTSQNFLKLTVNITHSSLSKIPKDPKPKKKKINFIINLIYLNVLIIEY